MEKHRFRITVEHLEAPRGKERSPSPLRFEVANHDDILAIVERLQGRGDLAPDAARALGVGLKLFSEVMLEHKDLPLFQGLAPHFGEFMRGLKKRPA